MTPTQIEQMIRYLDQTEDSDADKVVFMRTFLEDLLERMHRDARRYSKTADTDSTTVAA